MVRPLFAALIVAAILTPVVFRRQRRKAGLSAGALTPRFRRRLFATMGISTLLLVIGLSGMAFADNGDSNGTKTGVSDAQVETVLPSKTPEAETLKSPRRV